MSTAGRPRGRSTFAPLAAPNPRRLRRVAVTAQVVAVLFMVAIGITGVTVATTPRSGVTPGNEADLVGPDMHPHLLIGIVVAIAGLLAGLVVLVFALRAERRADAAERLA